MSNVLQQASRMAERGLGVHMLAVGGGLFAYLLATWQWDRPGIFTLAGFFLGLTLHGALQVALPGLDRRVHSAAMSFLAGGGLAVDAVLNRSWIVAGLALGALLWAGWRARLFCGARVRRR